MRYFPINSRNEVCCIGDEKGKVGGEYFPQIDFSIVDYENCNFNIPTLTPRGILIIFGIVIML